MIKNFETEQLDVNKLRPSSYYHEIFPLRFGAEKLIESIKENGFKKEKPIILKKISRWSEYYEILDGVCRWQGAILNKISHIPALIYDLDSEQSRLYTIKENLHKPECGASLSLVQALVLELEICKKQKKKILQKK